ncbi:MAG: hypothetical protein LQ337_004578 [Flavoplaca oasis]|nr:MAG: hypothetical protein LQ337_004578 [Flavoplaca oasis]
MLTRDVPAGKRRKIDDSVSTVQTDNTSNMVSWFTSPFKNPLRTRNSTGGGLSAASVQYNDAMFDNNLLSSVAAGTIVSNLSTFNGEKRRQVETLAQSIELRKDSTTGGNYDRPLSLNVIEASNSRQDDSPTAAIPIADASDATSTMGSITSKASVPSSQTSADPPFIKLETQGNQNLLHTFNPRMPSVSSSSQLSAAKSTTPIDLRPQKLEELAKPAKASPRAKRIRFNELRPRTSIPQSLTPEEYAEQSVHAAYSSRLNPFALHQDEYQLLRNHICHLHVTAYLNIRNRILRLWVRNPLVGVTPEEAAGCAASSRWLNLAEVAYEWLLRNGYINFGCVEVPDTSHLKVRVYKSKRYRRKTIVVVGAGMAGLGCARQLEALFRQYHYRLSLVGEEPPKVIVLEGRNRIGGRVYSHPLRNQNVSRIPEHARCTAELGAHIITGFDHGNPLNMIIRGQLALHCHLLTDNSTLHDSDGRLIDKEQDNMVQKLFNDILDRASIYRHRAAGPVIVEGNKKLIEDGRDPQGEADAIIGTTEKQRLDELARAGSDELEDVPGGMDKLTGKAHMVMGSRKKAAPAEAAKAMGWKLASNVLASRDLNLDAVARGMEDPTLGATMDEAVKQYQFLLDLSPQDMRLINWHYANLEYANAVNLSQLSLSGWDQDTGNEFDGQHAQVVGGYQQVARGILSYPSPLDLRTRKVVQRITYDPDGRHGGTARIQCDDGEVIDADKIVLTTPLGILKEGDVTFDPPLPDWKAEAINRLGFGTLNKIVLVYDKPFWDVEQDMFGLLRESDFPGSLDQEDYVKSRGKFYLFWNCIKTSGRPVLIALIAGDAAVQAESTDDAALVTGVTKELRLIFKDTKVPMPSETIVTRWGNDRFARGTYSYVGPTSLVGDYDAMAQAIGNLHFAGEATCGTYPATVHGAYISGLRAAAEVVEEFLKAIEVPHPLVPGVVHVDSSPKRPSQKRKAEEAPAAPAAPPVETQAAKEARLDALERDILNTIWAEIGLQPSQAGSKKGSNPFLLYSMEKWEECKQRASESRRTSDHNSKKYTNDIRSIVAAMWRKEPEEVKRGYREKTSSNRLANSENAATFEARLMSWNERALEIRRKYLEDRPNALSAEEEQSMWKQLGVYDEQDRKAKRMSGYALKTESMD